MVATASPADRLTAHRASPLGGHPPGGNRAGRGRSWRAAVSCLALVGVPAAGGDGVDVISVARHGEVRGRVVAREDDGTILVAVRRAWLADAIPALAESCARDDRLGALAARDDVRRRIEATLAALPEDDRRRSFLARERERVERLLADPAGDPAARAEFTWVRVPARAVRRERPAEANAARVVEWAWHERLAGAETRAPARLAQELADKGVDPRTPPPPLADRLPPRPQDDRQWEARLALVADALDEPVAFQGIGDLQLRLADGDEARRVIPLIEQLLAGSFEQLLAGNVEQLFAGGFDNLLGAFGGDRPGPLPPPRAAAATDRWLVSARDQAGAEGRCRATRLRLDVDAGRVAIESAFQVRFRDGHWETVWHDREIADGTAARPIADDRLAGDARVRAVLDTVRRLGVVDEATIDRALRMGAATLEGLAALDGRFASFRSLHSRALDGPLLSWSDH